MAHEGIAKAHRARSRIMRTLGRRRSSFDGATGEIGLSRLTIATGLTRWPNKLVGCSWVKVASCYKT